ncbi:MAG TPA: xyloglucanase [Polyangiaceae bacterium]|nr:xyloglucanase [Polyangiaceae bacterium]
MGIRSILGSFSALSVLAACATPQAPAPAAPAPAAPTVAPTAPLPPTSSEGTPYTWKNVTILGGGFVTGVVFSPAKANVVYARTDVGGAYRLDPASKTWIPLTDMFGRADSGFTGIESIAPDPIDANKVYAAVGTYVQTWAPNGAILRSNDQGNTWQKTDMPLRMGGNEYGRSMGERLAVDPNKTDTLLFGSRKNGLWKSTDAAVTWTKVDSFPMKEDPAGFGIGFVLFDGKSGQNGEPTPTIYAGVASGDVGLYVSSDAGATWKPVPKQPPKLIPSHAAFDSKGVLYLSYANGPGPGDLTTGAIWKYEPKAGVWTNISPLTPSEADKFGYGGLAVDAAHPGTLMVTTIDRWTRGDEIFRSTDGGRHWSAIFPKSVRDAAGAQYLFFGRDKLGPAGWMGDIDIDPFNPNHVMHVCGQGLWASDDVTLADKNQPTHWTFRDQGLEETVVTKLVSPPVGAELLSGVGDICGFYHDDLAKAPSRGMFSNPICNAATGLDYAGREPLMVVRSGNVWGEGKHGAFSTDGGKTWAPFASEPKGADTGGVVAVAADASTILWAVKKETPVYTRSRGASWSKTVGLPNPVESAGWVPVNLRPAADRMNPKKFYVLDTAAGNIYVSRDGAANFEKTASGLPELPDYARTSGSIEAMPGVEGDVWVTSSKDVYRSTDSGTTFKELGTVEESHALGFGRPAPGRVNPSVYLVGKVKGSAGFFRSDDLGVTWVRINDDAHQFGFVGSITGDLKRFGRVYVGTGGRGILYGDPK